MVLRDLQRALAQRPKRSFNDYKKWPYVVDYKKWPYRGYWWMGSLTSTAAVVM